MRMKVAQIACALALAFTPIEQACSAGLDEAPALAAAPAPLAADPIEVKDLVRRPAVRYLVLGELHGTMQNPEFFGSVVAEAQHVRPVTVVLELPIGESERIARFLRSKGEFEDRRDLLNSNFWNSPYQDGRSSAAMIDLLERLRKIGSEGFGSQVVLCQPARAPMSPELYEETMARCWQTAGAAKPNNVVLILVGNAHASHEPVFGYKPSVGWLPANQTVSFNYISVPGQAWNCDDKGCGPRDTFGDDITRPRGLYLGATRASGMGSYDGLYSAGAMSTASPPAAGAKDRG
jgi:hypothetical protein